MPLASAKSSRLPEPGCQFNSLPDLAKLTTIPVAPDAATDVACAAPRRLMEAGPKASKWMRESGTPQSSSAGTRASIIGVGPQM